MSTIPASTLAADPPARARTVVVAGGSSGIGAALRSLLTSRGEHVTNLDRTVPSPPGTEDFVELDLRDVRATIDAAETIEARGVPMAGLAVVAGIGFTTPFEELSPSAWTEQLEANLGVAFNVCHAFARRLTAPAGIVLLASSAIYGGPGASIAYSAAKAGIVGMTRSLARELAPRGLRVNAVIPGPVDTPLFNRLSTSGERRLFVQLTPLQRLADPADVAEVIAFLLGPGARHVTGQAIPVDGGLCLAFRPAL